MDALIQLERTLRNEWLTKGIPRDIGMADRLSVARRLLQEATGLVMRSKPLNEIKKAN